MSDALEAFEELLDAQEAFFGVRLTATVGSVTNKDCIPTEVPSDHAQVAGGMGETGTMQLQMRVSDFPTPLARTDEGNLSVSCKGKTLTLLSFSETGGVYTINAGDISAEVN